MREEDMDAVVAIHNTVNERCWNDIREWEKKYFSACGEPKLLKFQGRAQDYSPRARLYNLLGYKLPFDRHDWTIERCGKQVRYVIDFYQGKPQQGKVSIFLEVRPALDSFGAFADRFENLDLFAKKTTSIEMGEKAGKLKPTESCPVQHDKV